jgi:hypothetical protein
LSEMRVDPCFLLMRPYLSGLKSVHEHLCGEDERAARGNVCGDVLRISLGMRVRTALRWPMREL